MQAETEPDVGSAAELERLRARVAELEGRSGGAEPRSSGEPHDSTDAEQALREKEALLRQVIDLVPAFIFAKDKESRFLLANQAVADAYGVTVQELVDRSDADFTATPEEARHFHEDDLDVIRSGRPMAILEEPITDAKGKVRYLQTTKIPFRFGPTGLPAVLGVAVDITDRRLAENRLAQSEQRYRLLAETAQDVIILHDMAGRISYINPAGLRLSGYTAEEALALNVAEILAPEWRAQEQKRMERRHAGDRSVFRFETEGLTRDGRRVALEVSGSAIGAGDRVEQILAIARDITERKRSEAALRESEQRLREMLETVQLAAVMLDLSGRITFCNEHLAELCGRSRLELLGQDWFDVLTPEHDRLKDREEYRTAVKDGKLAAHFEQLLCTAGGDLRQVVWDATLLRDEDGTIVGVARLGRDVTELRKLEEQYRQAQKMEAVGLLAGGVAHDFNNLLQVILGYIDLAHHSLGRGRAPFVELDQVAQAASRASALVRQLLTFSRREELRREKLDLDEVIANLAKMLRRVLGEHVELIAEASAKLPPVLADPGHVEQVLLNLCVNARDAMPTGGTILISTSEVTLDAEMTRRYPWAQPGQHVLLSVADTGSGMTPEVLEHLFEPFFTTKEVGKGTGLGLATVYGIVRQHNGVIEVESEVGRGSQLKIYLPAATDELEAPALAPTEVPPPSGGGETVLVAEDDERVLALAVEFLTQAGYRVLVAQDGEEALRVFDREGANVDLFILDMIMPGMSGRAVCDAIRAERPQAKVLFSSGYSATSLDSAGSPDADFVLLQKPYSGKDLLRTVRELLDGR